VSENAHIPTTAAENATLHALFVAAYVTCWNAGQAGEEIGKTRDWGRRVYDLPDVRRAVAEKVRSVAKRAEVDAEDLATELGAIATYSVFDFFCEKDNGLPPSDEEYERWIEMRPLAEIPDEARSAIANFTVKSFGRRRLSWPVFHDKMTAIQTLGVHFKMFDIERPPADPKDFIAMERQRQRLARAYRAMVPEETGSEPIQVDAEVVDAKETVGAVAD